MTIERTEHSSRRALLATGLGGLVAAAAALIGRPLPVQGATQGQAMEHGKANTATAATTLTAGTDANPTMYVENTASRAALKGKSVDGDGLAGESSGFKKSGVYGRSNTAAGYGVFGYNHSTKATGSLGSLAGVEGVSTGTAGPAGRFINTHPDGTALTTEGKVRLTKVAGVATIPQGSSSVTVTPGIDITGEPAILLTARRQLGNPLWATSNQSANTITIRTSLPVTTNTKVSYLIIHA